MGGSDRNYAEAIKKQFDKTAEAIKSDLYSGKANNDFVKDENGVFFKKAIFELEKCGIKCYDLCNKVDSLMWYVGGDAAKIKELQYKLNSFGISGQNGRLKEDGVYGKETLSAWNKFFEKLVKGALPKLAWVDPLQTKKTGITHRNVPKNKPKNSTIYEHYDMKKLSDPYTCSILFKDTGAKDTRLFMFDTPEFKDGKPIGYHINVKGKIPDFVKKFDHKQIPEDVYLRLKNFGETAKKVRVAGRSLLVAAIALDVIELCKTIDADLKDSDKKLGRKTASNI
jgi:6-phosphofructokinase